MTLRRLVPADAAAYRALSLRAYVEAPAAFTATPAEREGLPLAWWRDRLGEGDDPDALVVGAFDGPDLVGVAGLRRERRPRTAHKGWLFGMAVASEARGRGVGRALVEAVLEAARAAPGLEVVRLTVTAPNGAARRLYEACGFEAFGVEPRALRDGDGYLDVVHMARTV